MFCRPASTGLGIRDSYSSQATKGVWWMPRRQEAMKDVASCDKLRVAVKQAMIRRFPNGATRSAKADHPVREANPGN